MARRDAGWQMPHAIHMGRMLASAVTASLLLFATACDVTDRPSLPAQQPAPAVYAGSEDGCLYAIDGVTSQQRWIYSVGDGVRHARCGEVDEPPNAVHTRPLVANGRVYFGSHDHYVYALDSATGSVVWRYFRAAEAGASEPRTCGDDELVTEIESSPTEAHGTIYIGSQYPDNALYALDATTRDPHGALQWRYQTGGAVRSSPIVADGLVYFGSDDWNVYALDAITGLEVWRFRTRGAVRSSPRVDNGIVYIGSDDGYVYALDATTGMLKWRRLVGGSARAAGDGGSICQGAPQPSAIESSPAVGDGRVYVGSLDYNVYALDTVNGDVIWHYATGGDIWSSPAEGFGTVYIGSDDGGLYALDAATGALRWRCDLHGEVESSPALVNGTLYVGSDDHTLYAFDTTGHQKWAYQTGGDVVAPPTGA